MSITRTTEYQHLMAEMGIAGIRSREDRLIFASEVLGKEVTSYTRLTEEEVSDLLSALKSWKTTQEIRLKNGVLMVESAMTVKWMNETDNLLLSEQALLPDEQSRRNFMSKINQDITEGNYAVSSDSLDDVLSKAMTGLNTSAPTRLTVSDGRWEDWRVVPAPTTSMGLVMGIGGLPRGKVIHLWGQKHAGKSMLSYTMIAKAQEQGIPCVLIDAEAAATGDFIGALGVDVDALNVVRPNDLEELCTLLRRLADSGYFIVVDSIAAAESSSELERNLSKDHARVGGNARLWISTLSTIRAKMLEHGTTLVLINQVRAKMEKMLHENPYKAWGSEGIQHHVDISMMIMAVSEKNSTLKGRGYKISRCRFDKNRLSGDSVKVDLHFKPGFPYNRSLDILRVCGEEISAGSGVTYSDISHNVLVADGAADDNGELIKKANRFAIRIDPLMMAAIQIDEPDFYDVDITPLENWDQTTIPDVDQENSTFFTIPKVGVISAAAWLNKHPTARAVLDERMLNGLKNKREMLGDD